MQNYFPHSHCSQWLEGTRQRGTCLSLTVFALPIDETRKTTTLSAHCSVRYTYSREVPPFPKHPPSRGIRESRSWIHSAQDPNSSLILFLPTRPDGFGRMGNVTFFVCHTFLERKFYHLEVPKFTTTHHHRALLKSSEPVVVDIAYTCVHGVSETCISEKKVH